MRRPATIIDHSMAFSCVRGWGLGAATAASLLACNLLLGNEDGQVAAPGASSSGAPSPLIDAAMDAPMVDGSATGDADAAPPRVCRGSAAPTAACFTNPDSPCVTYELGITWTAPDAGAAGPAYPHGLALSGDHLYYSAQANDTDGKNDKGPGQLFRVDRALSLPPQAVSPIDMPSASAPTIRDGFLFWRTWNSGAPASAIHRLDLSKWTNTNVPCTDPACGYEQVASTVKGRVTELWAASPTDVYARTEQGLQRFRKTSAWTPSTLSLPDATNGRLRQGFWTGWTPGLADADAAGQTTLYSLFEGGPRARLQWTTPPAGRGPIPSESSLVATSCDDVLLYEPWEPPLRRVNLDAGLDAGIEQKFSPLGCQGCGLVTTYAHVADSSFSYLGRPKEQAGLLAVDRRNGTTRQLANGEVWDIVVDDDAVYFTTLNFNLITRIAKHN